jgi:chitin synthase
MFLLAHLTDDRNELWDNDNDNHSLSSWVPEKQPFADSRAPSFYGHRTEYAESRISPAASQVNLRGMAGSRAPSAYGQPSMRNPSMYGDDARSMQAPSMYGAGMPVQSFDQGSHYGSYLQHDPYAAPDLLGHYPVQQQASTPPNGLTSRPSSRFMPEQALSSAGGNDISDGQLEAEIRNICLADGTDLETLTKKGVRKELERRFGMDLAAKKEVINRTIERVLTGA